VIFLHLQKPLEWLKERNLFKVAKRNFPYFKRVIKDCLKVKKEEVLIIGDKGYPDRRIAPLLAASYYIAAKKLGFKARLLVQDPKIKGDQAEDFIVESMCNLQDESVLVLALSDRLGKLKELGKSYRRFVYSRGHRFVSMPSLGSLSTGHYYSIIDAINIDYKKMQDKANKIKNTLEFGKEIRVITEKGTDLSIDIRGRNAKTNDGNYSSISTGGNLPAGEVYIAPRRIGSNGKVVIDGTIRHRHGTLSVKTPVTLTIQKGSIKDIKGSIEANVLSKTLHWAFEHAKFPSNVNKIGEFGIGLNPRAKLIGATIVDEKTLGTAHIAIGSNYWFGGTIYTIIHLDQIFKNPEIFVDGERLKV